MTREYPGFADYISADDICDDDKLLKDCLDAGMDADRALEELVLALMCCGRYWDNQDITMFKTLLDAGAQTNNIHEILLDFGLGSAFEDTIHNFRVRGDLMDYFWPMIGDKVTDFIDWSEINAVDWEDMYYEADESEEKFNTSCLRYLKYCSKKLMIL